MGSIQTKESDFNCLLSAEWLTEQILLEGCSYFRMLFSSHDWIAWTLHIHLIKAASPFTDTFVELLTTLVRKSCYFLALAPKEGKFQV